MRFYITEGIIFHKTLQCETASLLLPDWYFRRTGPVHIGRRPLGVTLACDLSGSVFLPGTMWLARPMQHPGRRVCRLLLSNFRLFSPSAAGRGDAPAPPAGPDHFMVDYLVSSCGLSSVQALKASRSLTHLKSSAKPDAVLRLLRETCLSDEQIRTAVTKYPRLLLFKPEKTLEPKIKVFQVAGFSGSEVAQLISLNPSIIYSRDLLHRLEFWKKVAGTKENVVKAVKRKPQLLGYSLNGKIIPRLSLLRDLGVPDDRVAKVIVKNPRWVCVKSDWIKTLVSQIKSLGFMPGSRMFVYALLFVSNVSRSTMDTKCELLRSYGWTQAELMTAILRFPCMLACSEKKIQDVMGLLLNEAGCKPSYVARHPALLGLSMAKRLIPRNFVQQSLKKRGVSPSINDYWTMMKISDDKFIQKFIVPYNEQIPELLEAYHAIVSSPAKDEISC